MAVNFPANPAVGDTFLASNGVTYQWNGYSWVVYHPPPDGGGGGPPSPSPYLPLAGGVMTGELLLAGDPVSGLGAASKFYVDAHAGGGSGGGIEEAPINTDDPHSWGRQNAAWTRVLAVSNDTLDGGNF